MSAPVTGTKDIAASLDAVLSRGSSTANSEVETTEALSAEEVGSEEETEQTPKGKDNKQVPLHKQPRFQEVLNENKQFKQKFTTYEDELKGLRRQLAEVSERNNKLVDILESKEEDSAVIGRIRELSQTSSDQRVLSAIDVLDKAVKDELEQVTEDAKQQVRTGELSKREAQQLIAQTRQELEDKIDAQKENLVIEQVNIRADEFLKALPEDRFNDEDREHISEMWARRVDWDRIKSNPKEIMNELTSSFDKTVSEYGTPKGALVNELRLKATQQTEQKTKEESEPSAEEIVAQLQSIKWNEMEGEGKDRKAKFSDEAFSQQLGNLFKLKNRGAL